VNKSFTPGLFRLFATLALLTFLLSSCGNGGNTPSGQPQNGTTSGGVESGAGSDLQNRIAVTLDRGNAGRTGFTAGEPVRKEPVAQWKQHLGGAFSSAALTDGTRLYLGGLDLTVRALSSGSGEQLWKTDIRGSVLAAPALAGNQLIVGSSDGLLRALETETGSLIWEQDLQAVISGSPLVAGDVVYVTTSDGRVAAMDIGSGNVLWETSLEAPVSASLSGDGDHLFVTTEGGSLVCLDRKGAILWQVALEAPAGVTPVATGAMVIAADGGGGCVAVSPPDGRLLWQFQPNHAVIVEPAVSNGVVVLADAFGTVYGLGQEKGDLLWQTDVGAPTQGGVTGVGDTAYVLTERGDVAAIDVATGTLLWMGERHVSEGVGLSPGNGVLYVTGRHGTLVKLARPQALQGSDQAPATGTTNEQNPSVPLLQEEDGPVTLSATTEGSRYRFVPSVAGVYRVVLPDQETVPVILTLYDSQGVELDGNLDKVSLADSFRYDYQKGHTYYLETRALRENVAGRQFRLDIRLLVPRAE